MDGTRWIAWRKCKCLSIIPAESIHNSKSLSFFEYLGNNKFASSSDKEVKIFDFNSIPLAIEKRNLDTDNKDNNKKKMRLV